MSVDTTVGFRVTIWNGDNNGDGTVTIHFYDSFETHNATWAWYTIDKQTGMGTNDVTFEKINFIQ